MSNYYDVDPKSQEWTALMNQIIELNPQIYDSGRKMLGKQVTMNSVIYTGDNFILPANMQQPTPRAGGAGGAGAPSSEPASSTPASSEAPAFDFATAVKDLSADDYDVQAIRDAWKDGMTEDDYNKLLDQYKLSDEARALNAWVDSLPDEFSGMELLSPEQLSQIYNGQGKVRYTNSNNVTYEYEIVNGILKMYDYAELEDGTSLIRVRDTFTPDGEHTVYGYNGGRGDTTKSSKATYETLTDGSRRMTEYIRYDNDGSTEISHLTYTYDAQGNQTITITHPKQVDEYVALAAKGDQYIDEISILENTELSADDIILLAEKGVNLTDLVANSGNSGLKKSYSTALANFFDRVAPNCSPDKLEKLVKALTGSNTTIANAIQWNKDTQETTNLAKYYKSLLSTYKIPSDTGNKVDHSEYRKLIAQLECEKYVDSCTLAETITSPTLPKLSKMLKEGNVDPHLIMYMLCDLYETDDPKVAIEKMVQEYRTARGGGYKDEQVRLMPELQNFIFVCLGLS